jgi:hypothetical protein
MKYISKSIMLAIVLVIATACSSVFENSGLSADDAAMLSSAITMNPAATDVDANYILNVAVSGDGENVNVTSTGHMIANSATGDGLISLAGAIDGVPDMGGGSFPFDLEFRSIGESALYMRGIASFIDPSMPADQWFFVDLAMATDMATSSMPLADTGMMTNGKVDIAKMYDILNANLFDTTGKYVQVTRGDDMDGMAHFTVTLDLGEWLGSDELQSGLQTLIPMLAGDAVPAAELQSSMSQLAMLPMVGVLFKDGTYQLDYYVDPASGSLSRAVATVDLTIDPATMGQTGTPATVAFSLDVTYNAFGPDSVVVAPENFIDLMNQ